jgi:type I restriction enzyme, S subunit
MFESTTPFAHPWPEDSISNIGSVTVGGTPKTSVEKYWDGDVPWMASGDVHLKRIFDVPKRITRLGLRSSNATLVDPPAVAIGLAGQGKTRGTAALVLCRLCTNQSVALITANPSRVNAEYLFFNLEYRYEELRSRSAGDGRAGLSKGLIEQIPVPLPHPSEQAKIAEILSRVDRAIEQTETLIAKQERIKTGLMQDLLTRGIEEHGNLRSESTHQFKDSPVGRIPIEWEVKPCVAICKQIIVGIVIRPVQYYRPDGVSVLRSANVRENFIDPSNLVYMSAKDNDNLAKSQIFAGDLVTVRTGYPGTTAVVPPEFNGCNCVDVVISRPDYGKVRSSFLSIWINSDLGKRQVLEGQGGLAQQHFNVGAMKSLLVKVPGLPEQQRIEEYLMAQRCVDDELHRILSKLHALKTALMQDLLTGRMRVTPLLELELTH